MSSRQSLFRASPRPCRVHLRIHLLRDEMGLSSPAAPPQPRRTLFIPAHSERPHVPGRKRWEMELTCNSKVAGTLLGMSNAPLPLRLDHNGRGNCVSKANSPSGETEVGRGGSDLPRPHSQYFLVVLSLKRRLVESQSLSERQRL